MRKTIAAAMMAVSLIAPASATAQAETFTDQGTSSLAREPQPLGECFDGDAILLDTGTFHYVTHTTVSDNGNVKIVSHGNYSQVYALYGGRRYHLTGGGSSTTHSLQGTDFPAVVTSAGSFNAISTGPGVNSIIHVIAHLTINANGEVTAVFFKFSLECRG